MKKIKILSLLFIATIIFIGCEKKVSNPTLNPEEFKNPPAGIKVHTWWHWLDGAITKEGITKDLESMKKQGIGQATILNVGLFNGKDFGVKRVVFDSPEWHELFLWALKEANRLDIKIGAHNCDGWSTSGGPWITPEKSMKQFVWTKTYITGNKTETIQLPQPYAEKDFYKDVAVLAFKTNQKPNSFQLAKPKIKINESVENKYLYDGDPTSAVKLIKGDKILISFEKDFNSDKILVHPRRRFMWSDMATFNTSYILSSSNDGKNFKKVKEFEIIGLNQSISTEIPTTKAKYYQIEVKEISNSDAWIEFTLAELELLAKDEKPFFSPSINHLLEKSVAVKASDRNYFNSEETANSSAINEKEIINLTEKMSKDGSLQWTVPEGDWCILRFGYTTTGALNGPATAEGTGLEVDKMDTSALNLHFNNYPKRLIETAGSYLGNTFKFLLIDSWECGYQNWTANLPAEFEKNRAYDMTKWIPVLCGEIVGNTSQSEAFLYDFRKTIADLIENNYYKHFRDLCHQSKLQMHAEIIYGDANYPPLEILRTNSYVDLPMFEFWSGHNQNTFTEYTPSKPFESFPVFAAAGYNIPVVGSEAYTAMSHYSESPDDLKVFGDRAFCSGINQMILHSYVHQPIDKKPGMTLGQFSSHFNRNNPYWQDVSEWLTYQARIQYVLQKGTIASNVLYYIGDQLPQYIDNEYVNNLPFGYRGMACNFDMLNKASVKNGKILLENGISYEILILPSSYSMEIGTLKRIAELVNQGAVIMGQKPAKQLSMNGLTKDKKAFEELANKVWGLADGTKITENKYGQGKVHSENSIAVVLQKCMIEPEFKTNETNALNLIYIHKKLGETDVFFVVNQTDKALNTECIFKVQNKSPQIWIPLNGNILIPMVFSVENGKIRIPVSFKPRESMIFVFENQMPDDYFNKVLSANEQIFPSLNPEKEPVAVPFVNSKNNEYQYFTSKNGSFSFLSNKNIKTEKNIKEAEVFDITNIDVKIEFQPDYQANIAPILVNELKPLNEYNDPQIKFFSGTAAYTIHFSLPENFTQTNDDLLLDLGKFESIAKVSLNKKDLGIAWMKGARLNINGLLQKENTLEVVVQNVFRNRIIGDYIQFGELKNVWTSAPVEQFLDKNKPLKPSGLVGPLKIIKLNITK